MIRTIHWRKQSAIERQPRTQVKKRRSDRQEQTMNRLFARSAPVPLFVVLRLGVALPAAEPKQSDAKPRSQSGAKANPKGAQANSASESSLDDELLKDLDNDLLPADDAPPGRPRPPREKA